MTILIAQQTKSALQHLSPSAQTILSLLPNIQPWLQARLAEPTVVMSYSSENELLKTILIGFYHTDLVDIVALDLTLGIEKLLAIDVNHLRDIYSYSSQVDNNNSTTAKNASNKNNSTPLPMAIQDILNAHQLATNSAIQQPLDQIIALGLSASSVYQSMNLSSRKMAGQIIVESQLNQLKKTEFSALVSSVDLAQYRGIDYIQILAAQNMLNTLAGEETSAVNINQLISSCFDLLSQQLTCPNLGAPPDQVRLNNLLHGFLSPAQNLGFRSIVQAIYPVILAAFNEKRIPTDWNNWANRLYEQGRACLLTTPAKDAEQLQDGNQWRYFFENSLGQATLLYDSDGQVCLERFNLSGL